MKKHRIAVGGRSTTIPVSKARGNSDPNVQMYSGMTREEVARQQRLHAKHVVECGGEPPVRGVFFAESMKEFNKLLGNRPIDRKNVEDIKKNILTLGEYFSPIEINEKREVLDGQNSGLAFEELGRVIPYIVLPGKGLAYAMQINQQRKNWGPNHFIDSHIILGNENYSRYNILKEEYGLPHTALLEFLTGGVKKGMQKNFKNGGFVLSEEQFEEAKTRLDLYQRLRNENPFYGRLGFVRAWLKISTDKNYDHERFCVRFRATFESEDEATRLYPFTLATAYFKWMKSMYNFKLGKGSRIEMFMEGRD